MSSPDARAVPDDFFADDESYVPKRALEDAAELKRELIRKWRAADGADASAAPRARTIVLVTSGGTTAPLERAQGTPNVRIGTATVPGGPAYMLCLPFATAPAGADCARGHRDLISSDMRATYEQVQSLEVHTFTDLNIFLANNPNYKALLQRTRPTRCVRARTPWEH